MKVRLATPKDAADIARIHVQTWQDAYHGLIPDWYLDGLSITNRTKSWEESLRDTNSHWTALVAEQDGNVVGWASLCPCRDPDAQKNWGEFGGLYVLPTMQHKGVGTALMHAGLRRLKADGFTKATLWVLTANSPSRKFYEAQGWKVEGKTKIDQRDGFELHETRYITDL